MVFEIGLLSNKLFCFLEGDQSSKFLWLIIAIKQNESEVDQIQFKFFWFIV